MTVIYEHPVTEHAKLLKKIEKTYLKIESLIKERKKHSFANILFLLIGLLTSKDPFDKTLKVLGVLGTG